jgi:hypothetical protein
MNVASCDGEKNVEFTLSILCFVGHGDEFQFFTSTEQKFLKLQHTPELFKLCHSEYFHTRREIFLSLSRFASFARLITDWIFLLLFVPFGTTRETALKYHEISELFFVYCSTGIKVCVVWV